MTTKQKKAKERMKTDSEILEAMKPVVSQPSFSEVCKRLGFKSKQSLMDRYTKLISLGLVKKVGNKYIPINVSKVIYITNAPDGYRITLGGTK